MSQTSLVTYCIQQNEKYELCQSAPVALPVVRKTSNKVQVAHYSMLAETLHVSNIHNAASGNEWGS